MQVSNKDRSWLEFAASIAKESDHKYKLGSVIVSGGRPLAWSPNSIRMSDMEPFNRCTEHAEEGCLRQLDWSAKGSTIYVVRLNQHGAWRLAKPCARCIALLNGCGVTRAVWSDPFANYSERVRNMTNLSNRRSNVHR